MLFIRPKKLLSCALVAVLQFLIMSTVLAQGMPAVVQAAKDADWEYLSTLLADVMQVNAVYGDGTSALHWASYHENLDAAQQLLESSAQVNPTTDLGVTPLWLSLIHI